MFWSLKSTKAARGQKRKTSQSTWEGATIPLKFLFFLSLCRFGALRSSKLLFFLSLCRFGALWSSKLLFFLSLCRFGALWSSTLFWFFLSLCRFGALWSSKPNAFVHLYFDIVSIACRYSWRILHFLLPMQLFEGSGALFMQRVYNLKIDLTLFKKQILFSGNWCFFLFEMSLYLKSYAFRMHFLPVFAVFLNMWSYWVYSYLVWWPPPHELESPLGRGWPYIYIRTIIHISYIHIIYWTLVWVYCGLLDAWGMFRLQRQLMLPFW